MSDDGNELLQAARSEDLVYEQIASLAVLGESERKIVDTLKRSGAHLLQGARGMGKSMLLRQAEVELDAKFKENPTLGVYVNFKTSTLLEGVKANDRDAFQIWVSLRVLQAIHDKLLKCDLIGHSGTIDPYERIFGLSTASSASISTFLDEKRHLLQQLATATDKDAVLAKLGSDFLSRVHDTTFLLGTINDLIGQFKIERVILLFDEAAHTFIPAQQEIFFEIFKLLHGGRIAVKAAVYPTVTSYGRNFEAGQDAIVISLDRFEPGTVGRNANRALLREMLEKRLPARSSLRKKIFSKSYLLNLCIDLSTGNPRAFLHLLNRALDNGYNDYGVLTAAQTFVDAELLPYHQNLEKRLPKYAQHVRTGLDLLRAYVIPEIRKKNNREKKTEYQSAFFTTPRDISPNLRLALDILAYSGVLTSKGTVKIAGGRTGSRYMVHLALMAAEKAFASALSGSIAGIATAIEALSLTDYREFAADDPEITRHLKSLQTSADKCSGCSFSIPVNAKFCPECGAAVQSTSIISKLLEEPVSQLSLGEGLRTRLESRYKFVGEVVQATRQEIMSIKYVKEVRSRIIKNAADEFISG